MNFKLPECQPIQSRDTFSCPLRMEGSQACPPPGLRSLKSVLAGTDQDDSTAWGPVIIMQSDA